MSAVLICTDCGRPRPRAGEFRWRHVPKSHCTDSRHHGRLEMNLEAAKRLGDAAADYHRAKTDEERAGALNDWVAVLACSTPPNHSTSPSSRRRHP